MTIKYLKSLESVKTWTIENSTVRIQIEKATGVIRSVFFKRKKIDLFTQLRGGIPGYVGGLKIFDEKDGVWYDDIDSKYTVTNASARGNSVSFTKQYSGAPFSIRVKLTMEKEGLSWSVEANKKSKKVEDRSLRVHFRFPLIAGWNVWAPCFDGERTFDGMTPFEHTYVQIPYVSTSEVILPMASHYNRELNVGYSMLDPIDAKVPAAKFAFNNADRCFHWRAAANLQQATMLETINYCIGLTGNRPMKTEALVFFHDGDWRPALELVYKRWKPYFVPMCDRMYDMEGMFSGCLIHWQPETGANLKKQMVKYYEIHGHFPWYGDYYSKGQDRWIDIIIYEQVWQTARKNGKPMEANQVREFAHTHTPREILAFIGDKKAEKYTEKEAEARVYTTRSHIKSMLADWKKNGIHSFWYFNYTDGFRPFVEENFENSICRNEDGAYQPSGWYMCHNLNSDPKYPFGKFTVNSAKKIIEEYKDIDGFFLDCFRHFEIDFAHDDGITVANNKPAYSVNFSYDDAENQIEGMLKKKKLCTFANKPQTIRQMKWVDGMMIEGDGDQNEMKYFWSCIAKPIIYLWTSDRHSDDEFCRRAVLYGCYPKASSDKAGIARRKKYMPLYDEFRRRVLCFDPDPIRVPKGCRGQLYTVGKNYVAGIINVNIDEGTNVKYSKTQYAMLRVEKGCQIGKVGLKLPGDKKFRSVKFQFNGTFIAVPLNGFTNCAVVKLFVTKKNSKKIGNDYFKGPVDSCGDPDSSFTDLSSL